MSEAYATVHESPDLLNLLLTPPPSPHQPLTFLFDLVLVKVSKHQAAMAQC